MSAAVRTCGVGIWLGLGLLLAAMAVGAEPGPGLALQVLAPDGVAATPADGQQLRVVSNLAAASYAAIFATALFSLALTLAVREAAYRDFTLFAALWGGFLACAHGHAFELPLFGALLGWGGVGLLLALGTLATAAALLAARGLLGLDPRAAAPAPARVMVWVGRGLAALALLLAILPDPALARVAPWWALLLLSLLLLPALAAAAGWRGGSRPAAAQCLLWLLFWAAAAAQLLVTAGWLAAEQSLRWLQQPGSTLAILGLSVALTDRVIALRERAETLQQLHEGSRAVLHVEHKRRELSEALEQHAGHAAAPSDLEWRAFRQLLLTLPEVLPLQAAALSITGYRGFDYLLVEPMSEKPRICGLLAERTATLKAICRSRLPITLPADPADPLAARLAVVPLPVPRPGWGALLLQGTDRGELSGDALELAGEFAGLAFKAIEQHARAVELRRRAESDPLSGLLNQRAGRERLAALLDAARHQAAPLSLLLLDVDLLRIVNERYGMPVGDQFLRSLGGLLGPLLRDQDLLFRHGGDEFAVALPGLGLAQAEALAEQLRAAVAAQRFNSPQGPIKITVSIGVAALLPGDDNPQRLLERALRAAELAKGQGRNQVARARDFGAAAAGPESPPLF
jgi:diguanylate cyclase (GGDEF)-like protein